MKIRSTTRVLALCATTILASHTSLQATLINVSVNDGSGGITSTAYDNGATYSSGWSGGWNATIGSGPYQGQFLTFCLDIGNTMSTSGSHNYDRKEFTSGAGMQSGAPSDNNDGTPPDPTWATVTSGQRAAWIYAKFHDSVNTAEERSAMCIAIWEALYEGSGTLDVTKMAYTLTSDRTFKATGSTGLNKPTEQIDTSTHQNMTVAELANYWLRQSKDVDFSKAPTAIWWAEADSNDPQSIVGPVPEPTTIIAGALLLLPFGASAIKRIRKSAKA